MSVDMIDEKLDFALAGLLGWVNVWDGVRLIWVDGATKEFRRKVTDWHPSSDPAASLEVQAKAIELDRVAFVNSLYEACYEFKRDKDSGWDEINIAFLLNASPCQRAEAAYMTLSNRD
ncbi:hypothetical protein [Paenibacillus polymyxa]|uniref:hypothetical protein n=1 Tax=Paenibacillus polymyxa TaxID=1406 RepID=UPI002222829D|nr:hypothetical protein [Paenibacillus polymyxa]